MMNRKIETPKELVWELLPEEFPYSDEGCELAASCLNCPFPCCIKEEPWGKERFLKRRRADRMLQLNKEGKSVNEIARIFEVSTRTVQRALKLVEEAQGIAPPSAHNDPSHRHCEERSNEAISTERSTAGIATLRSQRHKRNRLRNQPKED